MPLQVVQELMKKKFMSLRGAQRRSNLFNYIDLPQRLLRQKTPRNDRKLLEYEVRGHTVYAPYHAVHKGTALPQVIN